MGDIVIARSRDGETELVTVSGSAGISCAAELKTVLLQALDAAAEVRVNLASLEEIDLTGLQILCSAHQSAQAKGKAFQIDDGDNHKYREVVANAGFRRHVGCSRDHSSSCIWVGGES